MRSKGKGPVEVQPERSEHIKNLYKRHSPRMTLRLPFRKFDDTTHFPDEVNRHEHLVKIMMLKNSPGRQ